MTLIFLATKVIVNTGDSPPPSNNIFQIFLQDTTQTSVKVPLMRCICPFDGSYHTAMIRTNPTNRQEGFLGIQRVRNILSTPNEMHFSIGQRVSTAVSTNVHLLRIDDLIPTAQLFYDSYLFRCIGQPSGRKYVISFIFFFSNPLEL